MSIRHQQYEHIHIDTAPIDEILLACVDACQQIIDEAINQQGVCTIALSGGKTPMRLYQLMREQLPIFYWKKIRLCLVDERMVERHHQESNEMLIDETIMKGLSIDQQPVFLRINLMSMDPVRAALDYEQQLRSLLNNVPNIDLIILGLGEDGHTASIFTQEQAVNQEENRWVLPAYPSKASYARITLTLSVINQSKNIFFLVTGANKAKVVAEVLHQQSNSPAVLVKPLKGTVSWFLDNASASQLKCI